MKPNTNPRWSHDGAARKPQGIPEKVEQKPRATERTEIKPEELNIVFVIEFGRNGTNPKSYRGRRRPGARPPPPPPPCGDTKGSRWVKFNNLHLTVCEISAAWWITDQAEYRPDTLGNPAAGCLAARQFSFVCVVPLCVVGVFTFHFYMVSMFSGLILFCIHIYIYRLRFLIYIYIGH